MRDWLKQVRNKKQFTQKEIAFQCDISQQSYSFIETGERNPTVPTAKKIAAVLDFDYTKFYDSDTIKTA